jgi:hypothetical protein
MIETRFDRQGFGFWAVEVTATGTFIGFTTATAHDHEP